LGIANRGGRRRAARLDKISMALIDMMHRHDGFAKIYVRTELKKQITVCRTHI
jgi:hypothetical protein